MGFGYNFRILMALTAMLALLAPTLSAYDMERSAIDWDLHKVRFAYAYSAMADDSESSSPLAYDSWSDGNADGVRVGTRSPLKAFLLSMAIPGLGQYYYGSRTKPWLFLGAEITTWGLHSKWHGEGEDATDVYEDFNQKHWSQSDYEQYLEWAYGERDDDLITATEMSHSLPDTKTQQFYEMTGKYDQFSWGWDDAELNGNSLSDYDGDPPRLLGVNVPTTGNRVTYENQRDFANRLYGKARKMLVAALVNRLVSSFEAYFTTKQRNRKAIADDPGFAEQGRRSDPNLFSRIRVKASLKSIHARRDTPYVNLSLKF